MKIISQRKRPTPGTNSKPASVSSTTSNTMPTYQQATRSTATSAGNPGALQMTADVQKCPIPCHAVTFLVQTAFSDWIAAEGGSRVTINST